MNSKTSRLFRQVKRSEAGLIKQSDILRAEWNAASSPRARGHVNQKLRAMLAEQRVRHAEKMRRLKETQPA